MPAQLIEETLRAWRGAERLLDKLPPLTSDHESIRLAVIRLREIYTRVATLKQTAPETIVECRALLDAARETIRSVEDRNRSQLASQGPA